jgi:hypothetical protein
VGSQERASANSKRLAAESERRSNARLNPQGGSRLGRRRIFLEEVIAPARMPSRPRNILTKYDD